MKHVFSWLQNILKLVNIGFIRSAFMMANMMEIRLLTRTQSLTLSLKRVPPVFGVVRSIYKILWKTKKNFFGSNINAVMLKWHIFDKIQTNSILSKHHDDEFIRLIVKPVLVNRLQYLFQITVPKFTVRLLGLSSPLCGTYLNDWFRVE